MQSLNGSIIGLEHVPSMIKCQLLLSELVFSNWASGEPKSNQDRVGRITRMMDLLLNSQSNSLQSISPSMSIYFDGAGKAQGYTDHSNQFARIPQTV